MADDKGRSRRSFLGDLLTGAAGGWIALTSTSAVSAFLAACTTKKGSSAKKDDPELKPQVSKYGGPSMEPADPPRPMDMAMDPPVATKYGGPSMEPIDTPRPMAMDMDSPQATKYGGRRPPVMKPVRRPKKYGGPRRTKYGGRVNRPKYGGRRTKYGGRPIITDL